MQRKRAVIFALLLIGSVALPLRMRAQDVAAGQARIRSMIMSELGKPPSRLPSMAVAVVRGDAIVWEEAFGWADQQRRIAATPTTPYYLASVTKALTGTAVALLANEGKIDMNQSVNAYLGSHKVRPALWDEDAITVQRVADHTAGFTTFNLDCASAAPCGPDRVIDRFGVIVRPPDEAFDYSNLGYGILGNVIARTSKQRYGDFVRHAIFEPLGMQDCEVAADGQARRAAARYPYGTTTALGRQYSATMSAATAFCSAHSLALFARALLNPHLSPRGWPALLPSAGVAATQTGTPAGTMYRQGWWIHQDYVGTQSIYASGGSVYASATLRIIPAEKLAVVVLANCCGGAFEHVVDAVVDEFAPEIRERRKNWTPPPPFTRQRRPVSPELVGTWVGAIDTYRGKRPLTISIDSAGEVTGFLNGNKAEIRITRGAASNVRAFGTLSEADLGIDEATSGSYDVQFNVGLYRSRLAGSATTAARPGSSAPALAFLVELTRQ
jgi:CubicO group peptidase (beta-lactamase class C family)